MQVCLCAMGGGEGGGADLEAWEVEIGGRHLASDLHAGLNAPLDGHLCTQQQHVSVLSNSTVHISASEGVHDTSPDQGHVRSILSYRGSRLTSMGAIKSWDSVLFTVSVGFEYL